MPTSDTTQVGLYAALSHTLTVTTRYVTASGEDYWIFILIDKSTKEIISISAAPDHPSYENGGDSMKVPSPFIDFDPLTQEIILIDRETTEKLLEEQDRYNASSYIVGLIDKEYKIDFSETKEFIPLHSGAFINKKPVLVESIPDYIFVRKLLLMNNDDKIAKENKQIEKQTKYKQKKLDEEFKRNAILKKLNITEEEASFLFK